MSKRKITGVVLLVLFLSGGVWAYSWWHRSAETTVGQTGQSQTDVLGSQVSLRNWHTTFFETRYPQSLRVLQQNEIAQGMTTGQYVLSAVAATVGTIGNLQLADLPSVKFRQGSADYERVDRSFAPAGAVVFHKNSSYETAVFWQQGTQFAEVVVSGSSARQAELEEALQAIVTNWQWRTN